MTLLIAFLLIIGLGLSKWWVPAAIIVWISHLWFHDDSGIATGINRIYQRQHTTNNMVKDIKKEIPK